MGVYRNDHKVHYTRFGDSYSLRIFQITTKSSIENEINERFIIFNCVGFGGENNTVQVICCL